MADFNYAIRVILKHEGGWVSDPADPGGETNFGISMLIIGREKITDEELGVKNTGPGWLKNMKVENASAIYKKYFWDRYGYDRIVDDRVATKICDAGINFGSARAHRMAQFVCNQIRGSFLKEDGIIGKDTIKIINLINPEEFISVYSDRMMEYYQSIVDKTPRLKKFLWIWEKRAKWRG